jgi:hypothetical protein
MGQSTVGSGGCPTNGRCNPNCKDKHMIETLLMIGMDTLDGIEVERKLSLYI